MAEQSERPRRKTARRPNAGDGSADSTRGLAGAGHTQLPPGRALRARDVDRPDEADLAEAGARVQLVRRNWQPPD